MPQLLLNPLLTDINRIKREAVIRRTTFETISVAKSEVEKHIAEGWEIERELKIKTRLRHLNAGHESIAKNYKEFGRMIELQRASVLSGKSQFRKKVGELVLMSW